MSRKRILEKDASEIKRAVVEEMELHGGKLTRTEICDLPIVKQLLREHYERPKNGILLVDSFIKNVHGRFNKSENKFIPMRPESMLPVKLDTHVQLSMDNLKCTLQVRDAYEFAWKWVQYTRQVPPRKTSVRCSVHAALRCNRNGNQTAYGILWVRVDECPCATMQEATELFMPKIISL